MYASIKFIAGAMLTNYTKDGRKFKNNIRVGPVMDEMGKVTNFCGILRGVGDVDGEQFSNGSATTGTRLQLPFMA